MLDGIGDGVEQRMGSREYFLNANSRREWNMTLALLLLLHKHDLSNAQFIFGRKTHHRHLYELGVVETTLPRISRLTCILFSPVNNPCELFV